MMVLIRIKRELWRVLLALLLACAFASRVQAQVRISGKVLDGSGNGIENVIVTLHMSDGTQPTTTTKKEGKYDFPTLTTKGRVLWIEFSKMGTGYKELDDLSERTGQEISIVLGKTPTTASAIQARQAEIDGLLFRARFSPEEMSNAAKAYLKSDALEAEIKALPTLKVEWPRGARDVISRRSDEQKQHLAIARNLGEGNREGVQFAGPIAPETTTAQLLLLRQKSVQKELKLTDDNVKKIMEFTNKESNEYGKALRLDATERERKIEELERANKKFLADNLSAGQRKRLAQITLQVTGIYQLGRPEVAKVLNLTEEQQTKFEDLQKETRKALEEIITSTERAGKTEKLAKLREETNKKIMAALTDEQKAKAREIVGEPFKGEIVFEEPD
jgi:hypothetical protein